MKIIDIKLTYNCNSHCCLCCQDEKIKDSTSNILVEKIFDLVDNIPKEDIINTKVVLTGGEPTLHPQILEVIRYIKDCGFKDIQLQSNLTLKGLRFKVDDLIDSGITSFGISLHGHNAAMHEKFSCVKGSFNNTVDNLKIISSLNLPVSLNCVISRYNVSSLSEMVKFIQDNKLAKNIQFAFIHITGRAHLHQDLIPSISEAATEVHNAIAVGRDAGLIVKTEAIPFCLMRGYEKHVAEIEKMDNIVILDKMGVMNFSEHRADRLKAKDDHCKQCLFYSMCEGPWIEYPGIFGWDEFVPVRSIKR